MHTTTAPTPQRYITMYCNACKMHRNALDYVSLKNTLFHISGQTLFTRPLFSIVLSSAFLGMHTTTAPIPYQSTAMNFNGCKMHQNALKYVNFKTNTLF